MNKLGLSNTLIGIIAAVVAGLVIIGVLFPSIANAREGQAESLCKTSVLIRAGTAIKGGSVELQTSPLLCKTLTPSISKDSGEKVSREIATKMAKCWEMFGEGTYENSVFSNLNIFGGGKSCFTCYVLPVQETSGFKENKDAIPATEFVDFLRTAKYPAGSDRTFLQYFQTAGGPGNVVNLLTEKGIQPNHAYAISYRTGTGRCEWCGVIAGATAGTAGIALGAVLLYIPTGVTQIAGAKLILSGSIALGFSVGALTFTYDDIIDQAAIDTIILSDITSPEMNNFMRQKCNFVDDIEGKKLQK